VLFFTIFDNKVLKGIPVFGDKLGCKKFPLASVALVEGLFPKVLLSPLDNREYFSLNKMAIPDHFVDRGYFYQFTGEDHAGKKSSLMPIIIADQPYYENRSIVMIALRTGQSIFHERYTYPIWECCLPPKIMSFSYLKLIGIERGGWIDIVQESKRVSFESRGNKFDIRLY